MEKENISDNLVLDVPAFKPPQLSPAKKPAKKSRSKSIGPGGLDAVLKPDTGNRRKSAFVPAVKSILSSKEDESKRRDARRKSLANRRVSFAPEATLHTWDVIECMADATTSSSSSNSTRRASALSNAPGAISPRRASCRSPVIQSPSGLRFSPLKSPTNSRPPLIIKSKKRRSSGIPPLDFNNPEDVFSSSPSSDASPSDADTSRLNKKNSNGNSPDGSNDDDDDDTVTSIARANSTVHSVVSDGSEGSTSSNARLDEVLRQASAQAVVQDIEYDEQDELTMEIAADETTSAFKPWFKNIQGLASPGVMNAVSAIMSPSKNGSAWSPGFEEANVMGKDDEMTMEMTGALGGILQAPAAGAVEGEDATMDFTVAAGAIQSITLPHEDRRKSLKRRRSSGVGGIANELGSPRKRISQIGDVLDPASLGEGIAEDETMELTTAIGRIENQLTSTDEGKEDDTIDVSFGAEVMEFTTAVGGIKSFNANETAGALDEHRDENEELSMELTIAMGEISNNQKADTIDVETTPKADQKSTMTNKSPIRSPRRSSTRAPTSPKSNTSSPRSKLTVPQTPPKSPKHKPQNTPPSARSKRSSGVKISPRKSMQSQSPADKVPWSPIRASRFSIGSAQADAEKELQDQRASSDESKANEANERNSENSVNGQQKVTLSESIRNLSTPRKQIYSSPTKPTPTPVKFMTPKQDSAIKASSSAKKLLSLSARAPPRAVLTPRSGRKSLGSTLRKASNEGGSVINTGEINEKLHLRDFLEITSIRFMDLNTSKRRQTIAPRDRSNIDNESGEAEDRSQLGNYVVAAACTVPMLELYQHSCRELKKYITEGKGVIRTIESASYEENPAIFQDFISAPSEVRMAMDNQFKNMKTNARLLSKAMWYEWRSNLLDDLMQGLVKIKNDFDNDHVVLTRYSQSVDEKLPGLEIQYEQLKTECEHLQAHADALVSADRDKIEALRKKVVEREAEIEDKKRKLAELQAEVQLKEEQFDLLTERKSTFTEEIKDAQRTIEDCRGLSSRELADLRARVHNLEEQCGWTISSASSDTITLVHHPDLELFLHPSSFGPNPSQTSNSPIGLTYTSSQQADTLTTTKRFFLQLLRAHLQCMSQCDTTVRETLDLIRNTWAIATEIADAARRLNTSYIMTETIVSDEVLAIELSMLLRNFLVQTKVKLRFEIKVAVRGSSIGNQKNRKKKQKQQQQLAGNVSSTAEVVYGEKLNEKKMGEALGQMIGGDLDGAGGWYEAVQRIESKLLAKTR